MKTLIPNKDNEIEAGSGTMLATRNPISPTELLGSWMK
jgi:hypothetical protein